MEYCINQHKPNHTQMLTNAVWSGVTSLLDDYIKIDKEDVAVLIYTSDSQESAVWVSLALEKRNILTRLVWMNPILDKGFSDRLQAALPRQDSLSGRLTIITLERNTLSHSDQILDAVSRYKADKCAVIRIINAGEKFFTHALNVKPQYILARNNALLEKLSKANILRIKTKSGTDLVIKLNNNRYKWVSNHGMLTPGRFLLLPPGEVATYPEHIEGIFVADFAFNINTSTLIDPRLNENPVKITIENDRVVDYDCADIGKMNFLEECFKNFSDVKRIGEFGIGTNFGIDTAVNMNSHINERRPGIHLGFGQHNQPGIDIYSCPIHLDLITKGGIIFVDDEEISLDVENITPSLSLNATKYNNEDLFSPDKKNLNNDCCGIF